MNESQRERRQRIELEQYPHGVCMADYLAERMAKTGSSDIFTAIEKDRQRIIRRGWGHWKYVKRGNVLVYRRNGQELYWIDLSGITTSAKCLDVIFQITAKTWMSAADCDDLLEAIRVLIDPQGRLCSWGIERGRSEIRRAS